MLNEKDYIMVEGIYQGLKCLFVYNRHDRHLDDTVTGDVYTQNSNGSYEFYDKGVTVQLSHKIKFEVKQGGEQ